MTTPLLTVTHIEKAYPGPDGPVPILRGVSLSLEAGRTLALTGKAGRANPRFCT